MWSGNRSIGAVVAFAWMAAAGAARAQSVASVGEHQVELQLTARDTTMVVFGPVDELACGQHCTLKLSPGWHHLVVTHPNGDRSVQKFFVRGPSRVTVRPENRPTRFAGFLLMAGGVGVYGFGAFATFFGALAAAGSETADDSELLYAGLVGMGVGAAIAVTGGIFYAVNKRPRIEMTPLGPPPPPRARLELRPTAGPRWMGLALSGTF